MIRSRPALPPSGRVPPPASPLRARLGLAALAVLLVAGCADDRDSTAPVSPPGEISSSTLYASECKRDRPFDAMEPTPREDCVEWETDGHGTLVLRHINTAFNCCPDSFHATVATQGDRLLVAEHEVVTNPCACLCLFDLHTRVTGLAASSYEVEVEQEYLDPGDARHVFRVDLSRPGAGSHCIERDRYPWNVGTAR